jgi:hypothetical protein
MNPAFAWVKAFALTLVIEEAVVLALTKRLPEAAPRRALLVFFANLSTHPAVWWGFPLVFAGDGARIAASEFWAVALETIFYVLTMRMHLIHAFGVSAVANAASFGTGLFIRALTGWV